MPVNGFPIVSVVPKMTPTPSAVTSTVRRSINARRTLQTTMSKLAWRSMRRTRDSLKRRKVTKGKMPPKPSAPGTPPHTLEYTDSKRRSAFPLRSLRFQQMSEFTWRVGVAPFSPMAKTETSRKIPRLHETGGVNHKKNKWKYKGNPYGSREPRSRAAKEAYKRKLKIMFREDNNRLNNKLGFWNRITRVYTYPPRPYLVPGANKAIRELAKNNRLPFIVGVYFNR